MKWKHFPRYWPFVRGIHRGPVNSPHKGHWPGALMFLRSHRAHYDVIVMHFSTHCYMNWHLSLTLFSAKISNEFVATAFLFRINCYKLYAGISVLIICHSSASGFTFSHDWCPRGLRQPCLRCRSRVIIIFAIYQLMYQLNSHSTMKNLSIRCVRTYLKVCVNGRS